MSYVVTITRDVPDSSDGLIAPDEWRRVIAEDDSLHEKTTDHPNVIVVQWIRAPSRHEVLFVFENGAISVTTPDDGTLEKMQHVAKLLDARVIGESGEELTELRTQPSRGCASQSAQALLVLALLAIVAGKVLSSCFN